MSHPHGGSGSKFAVKHSFPQVVAFVGKDGFSFVTAAGTKLYAVRGIAEDRVTSTIVFWSDKSVYGSVCSECLVLKTPALVHLSASALRDWTL